MFSSHKQYLFGLPFSNDAKRTHTDQIILPTFLLFWKETSEKPLKVAAVKKSFQSGDATFVIIDATCFDKISLLHNWITGRHSFLYKPVVTQSFSATPMLLHSLKQVLWKKSAFYIRYLRNKINTKGLT